MQKKSDQNQRIRWVWKRIGLLAILAVVASLVVAIVGGYVFGWDWVGLTPSISPPHPINTTFQPGKTVWDWLQLLVIPVVLAGAALWFNARQGRVAREIAADQQQESALQAYLVVMTELLIDKGLRDSKEKDPIRSAARAQTLTILRRLLTSA